MTGSSDCKRRMVPPARREAGPYPPRSQRNGAITASIGASRAAPSVGSLASQVPGSSAGRLSIVVSPPRLHPYRITRHDDEIGAPAAAFRAAELEILYRLVALPGFDDRLEIGRAPAEAASPAPHPQTESRRSPVSAAG